MQKQSNGSNEIPTVHMPDSSQKQTNKTKEAQQLTSSFVSKSSPSNINIRFWSQAKKKACGSYFDSKESYFDSKFLGHATANDLLASFSEIINTLDSGNKMMQIWMDHQLVGNCLNLLKKIEKKRNKRSC